MVLHFGGAAILLPDPLWLAPLTPWPHGQPARSRTSLRPPKWRIRATTVAKPRPLAMCRADCLESGNIFTGNPWVFDIFWPTGETSEPETHDSFDTLTIQIEWLLLRLSLTKSNETPLEGRFDGWVFPQHSILRLLFALEDQSHSTWIPRHVMPPTTLPKTERHQASTKAIKSQSKKSRKHENDTLQSTGNHQKTSWTMFFDVNPVTRL